MTTTFNEAAHEVAIEAALQAMEKKFREVMYPVAKEIANRLIAKQKDYGKGNILKFGLHGILVRTSDKIERLINLETKPRLFESLDETWGDAAGYALLALMLMRGTFELPLKEE